MRKLLLLCAVCLLLVFPVVANAIPISADHTGTRSTADGNLTAAGGWSGTGNNGFEIGWDITSSGSGDTLLYHYEYTISGVGGADLTKDLSHWILEVTDPSLATDFENVSPAISEDSPKLCTPQEGNKDMPDNIYGIKWETEGTGTWSFAFTTYKDPVWGDFYAKNGKESDKTWTTAWNDGFGTDPDAETTVFTNWIATPNGGNGDIPPHSVPEPATMLLLGCGLIGIAVSGKKRFKRRNG